jgi:hypothetical protein
VISIIKDMRFSGTKTERCLGRFQLFKSEMDLVSSKMAVVAPIVKGRDPGTKEAWSNKNGL